MVQSPLSVWQAQGFLAIIAIIYAAQGDPVMYVINDRLDNYGAMNCID
jgi:hypothetical protein